MSNTVSSATKVPKLRFPEFTDEWQVKRIGDILSIGNGRDYKHLKCGDIPVYGTGGYMLSVDQYLYDGESVAIGRKGTIDKPQFLTGKFWTVDTLFYTHKYRDSVPRFVLALFDNINWQKYNEASGVPSLSKATIEKIKTNVPVKNEQQKIASFLSEIDATLTSLSDKVAAMHEYKRGVMQAIFSGNLRFKDENGEPYPDWETKRLGELFNRVIRRNKESNRNILTISAQHGLVSQDKFFSKLVAAKDVGGYYLLHRDDYAYNKSYSKGYPMGAIKRLHNDKGVVSTLYICFSAKEKGSEAFFDQYFESGQHNKELEKIAQEGARNHGLLNMSIGDFFDTILIVPSPQEQQRIANFLSAIDRKIELMDTQFTAAKDYKKALLQRMFV